MAELFDYKCPACGAAMVFDAELQKMKCPYCDTIVDMSQFQEQVAELEQEPPTEAEHTDADGDGWIDSGGSEWTDEEKEGLRVYSCKSCGGEIIADAQTGATTCPYCGSNVVMKGQFEGRIKPDKILPFKITKKQAIEEYNKLVRGRWLLPPAFRDQSRIEKIQGVYVPYWVFSTKAHVDLEYEGTKVHAMVVGDVENITTEHFAVERSGDLVFENVPADCSTKIDDIMTESIEPFDYSEAVPFQPAYMAGFLADRYDEDVEKSRKRAEARIVKSADIPFRQTIQGSYSTLNLVNSDVRLFDARNDYALLPVWLINISWNGQTWLYAINGQTGKTVGDFPEDKGQFWKYVVTRGIGIAAVVYAVTFLFSMF